MVDVLEECRGGCWRWIREISDVARRLRPSPWLAARQSQGRRLRRRI